MVLCTSCNGYSCDVALPTRLNLWQLPWRKQGLGGVAAWGVCTDATPPPPSLLPRLPPFPSRHPFSPFSPLSALARIYRASDKVDSSPPSASVTASHTHTHTHLDRQGGVDTHTLIAKAALRTWFSSTSGRKAPPAALAMCRTDWSQFCITTKGSGPARRRRSEMVKVFADANLARIAGSIAFARSHVSAPSVYPPR
jgi:hypothetical protein